jgi:hypothetical protein
MNSRSAWFDDAIVLSQCAVSAPLEAGVFHDLDIS